jgi:hypothetical protein
MPEGFHWITDEEAQTPSAPTSPVYTFGPKPKGMVEEGNLDIRNRPIVKNPNGSVSTERSFSDNFDGVEVLLPTVIDGKIVSREEAIDHYKKTGENLGKFKDAASADVYAENLHNRPDPRWQSGGGPEPGSRQAMVAENRQRLIDAIKGTEDMGYKVPHKIGEPNEPEGDRSPTQDMESLVSALKRAEKDTKDPDKLAGIKNARLFWEDKIATEGMSAEQEKRAATPHYSLSQEMGFAKEGSRFSAGLGAKENELPRATPQMADQLGLKSWIDPSTGTEVRRATLPDVRPAVPVYGGTPSPTPLVPKKYQGMSVEDMQALDWMRTNPLTKELMRRSELSDVELFKAIKNDVGMQAVLQFTSELNQALPSIPAGTLEALSSITQHYVNTYRDKTPKEAAQSIPLLQKAIDLEEQRLHGLAAAQTGTGSGIVNTTAGNYPAPAQLPGKVTTPETTGAGYIKPTEAAGNIRSSITELANLKRQLAYAQERASGAAPTEGMAGKVSRYFGEAAKDYRKEQEKAQEKGQAFLNEDIVKRGPVTEFLINLAKSSGGTAPSLAVMMANPVIGALAMSAQQYDDSFQEAKKGGKTDEEARAYAFAQQEQMPWEVYGEYGAASLVKMA